MNNETKKCTKCYSEINCQAKVCHYCGNGQGFLGFTHTKDFAGFTIFAVIVIAFIAYLVVEKQISKSKQGSYLDLTPVVFQIHKFDSWQRHNVACLGEVKNTTNSKFENVFFEVTFFDRNNSFVDAFSFNDQNIIISENGTTKFKVYDTDTTFEADKYKCVVRIAKATISK
jgi:hypothetical protein